MARMRLFLLLTLFITTVLLLRADLIYAETIKLKNGTVIHGSIVQMTEAEITVDTADMGQIVVKRRAVQSFEDDTPQPQAQPAQTAAAPAGPVGISINNNNNNANTASSSAAATAVAAPPPAAEPAPAPHQPEPVPTGEAGFAAGSLTAGIGFFRPRGEDKYRDWSRAIPTIHWNVLGYKWPSGLALGLFAEGSRMEDHSTWKRQWMQGGLRADLSFARHATSWGPGSFFAGLGASHFVMKYREEHRSDGWDDYGYQYGESKNVDVESKGQGIVARVGYQILNRGSFGFDAGFSATQVKFVKHDVKNGSYCDDDTYDGYSSSNECKDVPKAAQTLTLTVGATYVL